VTKKWVYLSRSANEDLNETLGHEPEMGEMKIILGGKGAGLAEMTSTGLPVPPAFTITTEACVEYMNTGEFPKGMWEQTLEALKDIEAQTGKKFGDPSNPLLLSVRSGARQSSTLRRNWKRSRRRKASAPTPRSAWKASRAW